MTDTTLTLPPALDDFTSLTAVNQLIALAKTEDMGPGNRDITSELFVQDHVQASASIIARQPGRLAGAVLIPQILAGYDDRLHYTPKVHDGQPLAADQCVGIIQGPLRSLLSAERVVLNFLTHLSGIATLTSAYVTAVHGTKADVYDTRKTIPGLRGLHKYAIICGGGRNHRMGLHDAILVKDNHITHTSHTTLGQALAGAIEKARKLNPPPAFIEVEVDHLLQLQSILAGPVLPDIVLLDNMRPLWLTQSVALRDKLAPQVILEASGGLNLATAADIASTGVDRIAVGALTHSAPALDLGLDIAPPETPAS